jgi:CRISPR-associated protein Cmr2
MLLYVSSDKADNKSILPSEDAREAEIGEDMNMVAEGIRVMFTRYGFGAKTSSGYGVADDLVFQKLWIRRMGGNNA